MTIHILVITHNFYLATMWVDHSDSDYLGHDHDCCEAITTLIFPSISDLMPQQPTYHFVIKKPFPLVAEVLI